MERERLIGWLRTYADSHEGVAAHRDIMRRAADELQTVLPEERTIQRLRNQVDAARSLIMHACDIMEPAQVGIWSGVRSWLEQDENDYEPFDDVSRPQSRSPSEEK